jgi:hypothetical protein
MLTATVTLSGVAVLIATNISANQMSSEKLIVPSTHVWYINSTSSVGGIILTNSGQTDTIINKLTINGANCIWDGENGFVVCNKTIGSYPGDLSFTDITNSTQTISIVGKPYQFEAASQGISLKAGSSMAIYIATPDNIMVYNMGQPVTVVVTTTHAIYSTQANVESSA